MGGKEIAVRVLVTGGGGFIGGGVARRLLELGHTVRSLARGEYPELANLGIDVRRGDIASESAVESATRGCDAVIHTAAKAGVWGSRIEYERANVVGTRNVIGACHKGGCGLLVFTSSPSVVFDGHHQENVDESAPYPGRFLASYPRTKAEAERLVLEANGPNLATVALRPHLVWGPGDHNLVPRVLERAHAGALRSVRERSGQSRLVDSTFIDNAVEAHELALQSIAGSGAARGKAYFISNGEPLPMEELLNRILEAAGLPAIRRTVSPLMAYAAGAVLECLSALLNRGKEPSMTRFVARQLATAHWFDLSAARRDLGYRPGVSLAEGFQRLEGWLRSTSPGLKALS